MKKKHLHSIQVVIFLLPFFLYEDFLLSAILSVSGLAVISIEKIYNEIVKLEWREYVFFIYMFHMLFGERHFAYVGLEPLFVTELVLGILVLAYAKELLSVKKVLAIYYLLVMIGLLFAGLYFFEFQLDALRDSFMLIYALWVPIIYHVFQRQQHYEFFFLLLKLFIVLKAAAYCYEAVMILLGHRAISFEGFRFGVGYIVPALVVISLFLPLRHISMPYKILSLLMLPAVFTMFHRSIFLGIFLAVVVIFLLGSWPVKKNMLLYGATSLVLLIGFLIYYNSIIDVDLFRILDRKSSMDEGNINFRVISWEYVLEKFYENFILGYGVGKPVMYVHHNVFYSTIDLTYFQIRDLDGNAQPHNSYLNVLARFGILVFPFFMYAIGQPLIRIYHYVAECYSKKSEEYSMLLLLTGYLMLMYVFTFFNVVLEGPHHAFEFWLVIGMLLSFGRTGMLTPETVRIIRD